MILAGGVYVSYAQFYVTDGWAEQPLPETAFPGQVNGLCGARTGDGLFLITGLHTGTVPVEVEFPDVEPILEREWEDAVEVSIGLNGPDLIVLGWAGMSTHTVRLPAPGPYRVRYCAAGMDEGRRRDTRLEGEDAPDRYRLQFWPAPIGPDAILRCTSEIAAYWHGNVANIRPPAEPGGRPHAHAINPMTVVADATVDAQPVAADPGIQPADGREWFARHVSADPLRLVIELDPRSDIVVLDHDETTGSFRASLGHVGALARRPRSAEPWDLGWPNVRYRWSTTRWDWALYFYGAAPTARSVEALIEHLGDGV